MQRTLATGNELLASLATDAFGDTNDHMETRVVRDRGRIKTGLQTRIARLCLASCRRKLEMVRPFATTIFRLKLVVF